MNRQYKMMKIWVLIGLFSSVIFSCEKKLDPVIYGSLNDANFFKTPADATAAVNAMYAGLMEGWNWSAGFGSGQGSWTVQSDQTTDQGLCNWDAGGSWKALNALAFTPDFGPLTQHYSNLIPYISQITQNIAKIQGMSIDAADKTQKIGELKALRGFYMQVLFLYYGPVPVRLDPAQVNNLSAPTLPRPGQTEMVNDIVKDFTDAIAALPDKITSGSDYGRFSKAACYTSLMKLYMQLKDWPNAIKAGEAVKAMGFALDPDYGDLFSYNNKNGNTETILPVVCSANPGNSNFVNIYRPHYLPSDYWDDGLRGTSDGGFVYEWGGYRMPWKTYDKFNPSDYRLKFLLQKYPTSTDGGKTIVYKDARANGDIGAVMVKYGPDPTKGNAQNSGVNYVAMRYADVELLLAEALNEQNGGPTAEALTLLNDVHVTHGKLPAIAGGLNQADFRTAVQNERLFELWAEGQRRDDLIRWGQYIQRAKNDGHTNVDDHLILYPLPRSVVNQSKGVIAQNPGYN